VAHALDRVVVEVDVGDLDAGFVERVHVDHEVVVLRGDLDLAGGELLDRVVAAVVAELEAARAAAEGPAEELVAEADCPSWDLADQRAGYSRWRRERGGSAGPLERRRRGGFMASTSETGVWPERR
jgi:hypothetical protein